MVGNPTRPLPLPLLAAPQPSNWLSQGTLQQAGRAHPASLLVHSAQHDRALGTTVTNVILCLLCRAPCCMA